MPSHDAMRAPDPVPADRCPSRRFVLRGTAAAGAAGLAAVAAGAAASPALAAPGRPQAPDQRTGPSPATLPAGPIVVHVRDARSGDIEVFSGTSQTSLRDKDLAARIARAIG